jgi:capsular polysaccharide biosynthesis protein
VAVLCASLAFSYCAFIATPVYSARTSILVTNGGILTEDTDSISTNDLSASIYMMNTCVDILKSQPIYKSLEEALGGKYSYKELKSGFSISKRDDENLFIDITFKSTNKEEAIQIVNTFTQLCPQSMAIEAVFVKEMDMADSASKIYPQTLSSTAIFGILGAVISCVIIILVATLDQTIKDEEDFVENFDIPVLGAVPDFDNSPTYAYRSKTGSISTGG